MESPTIQPTAANNLPANARISLRRAGVALIAWLCFQAVDFISSAVFSGSDRNININLFWLIVGYLALRFMRGDSRYLIPSQILCWIGLANGIIAIVALYFSSANQVVPLRIFLFDGKWLYIVLLFAQCLAFAIAVYNLGKFKKLILRQSFVQ